MLHYACITVALLLQSAPQGDAALALDALGPIARVRADALLQSLPLLAQKQHRLDLPPSLQALFASPMDAEAIIGRLSVEETALRARPFTAIAKSASSAFGMTLEDTEPHGTFKVEHPTACVWLMDFLLNGARPLVEGATDKATLGESFGADIARVLHDRVQAIRIAPEDSRARELATKGFASVARAKLLAAIEHLQVDLAITAGIPAMEGDPLPDELSSAVSGTIVSCEKIPDLGWIIIGGEGPNEYDLGVIAAVFDFGGDDKYHWRHTAFEHRGVVDLAGNDVHDGGVFGPASGIAAIAFIDDHAGDDVYNGPLGGVAAGICGVGLIVDRAGNDVYRGTEWCVAVGVAGVGAIVDLAGDDRYQCGVFGVALGGPLGAGIVLEAQGNDLYRVEGNSPSVYGLTTCDVSWGIGMGFGFRRDVAGGTGFIDDFSGNDHSESGEFSQACGYYFGIGAIRDRAGDDVRKSDRYGIAAAAHQAGGVLLEEGGNDSYTSTTAANCGGAWDESVAVLIEARGDDSYHCDVLAIGAAAQQAFGLFVDRAGRDRYRFGVQCVGTGGTNEYHVKDAGLGSISLFLDLGGASDFYIGDASDNMQRVTGESPTELMHHLEGVAIDR
ncbi:MAG: hypothetical protein EXS10_01470 [Phycisphaerales bacterium]|nr:hypothetical protein [Phycisphaerales bacterium]